MRRKTVQFSLSDSLWPHESQHARPPCPSPTPGVYPSPCPSSRWCHPAISSSVVPFSSCPHLSQHQFSFQFQLSYSVLSDSLWAHELQHARPPCSLPTPGGHPNPCPLIWWCHPTISSSVVPFSFRLQSLPASGSSQMSQLFASGGQSIGVSGSTSVTSMYAQDWSPLGWTGWISLLSKWLSRVFSNTTVQKHQFFSAQLSSQSNSHIHTWPLEKP